MTHHLDKCSLTFILLLFLKTLTHDTFLNYRVRISDKHQCCQCQTYAIMVYEHAVGESVLLSGRGSYVE